MPQINRMRRPKVHSFRRIGIFSKKVGQVSMVYQNLAESNFLSTSLLISNRRYLKTNKRLTIWRRKYFCLSRLFISLRMSLNWNRYSDALKFADGKRDFFRSAGTDFSVCLVSSRGCLFYPENESFCHYLLHSQINFLKIDEFQ